ncbi:MAG: hypothetical protein JO053_11705, partial [Acidobacteria bacterium]|nr:hypothetical protein [Acidobacteriota bacterium]
TVSKSYVYAGSRLLSVEDPNGTPTTTYLTADHLGSPRINTDGSGSVVSRQDYMPFGEEITTSQRTTSVGYPGDSLRHRFTGYQRDEEIRLDFASSRNFAPQSGRFTVPDDFTNDTHAMSPQSWNLYVYVQNDPLVLTDPNGERVFVGDIKNSDDLAELLKRINATYGCSACVSVDKDHFLSVDTSSLSKEVASATGYLTGAITSTDPGKLFSVQITNNSKEVPFGDSQVGGAGVILPGMNKPTSAIRIRLDFADDKWVTGDKDSKAAFLNTVFAHEIAHNYPDPIHDPADGRETGPVVDRVNEIQLALNLPLRAEYSARPITTDSPFVAVSYGRAKMGPDGKPLRINGALQVEKQNKVVRWVATSVGGHGIN